MRKAAHTPVAALALLTAAASLPINMAVAPVADAAQPAPARAAGPGAPTAGPAPAGAASASGAGAKADAGSGVHVDLPVEKYTLENGLEVILHEDHRTPVVAVNIWYHVGSKDEAPHRNGFAHLFEHIMFQGSKHVGEDMFFKYLERAGASDRNGTTSLDRTNYYETVPSNQLPVVLWLESDRMGFLLDHVNEETFASQRSVVKNERRQNYENAPYGLVRQFVAATIYPNDHPYHFLTIGSPEDLDAARLDDVKTFFRTFYVPNNATLVVAGDIDMAKTKELVTTYFAPIAKGAAPPGKTTPTPVKLSADKRLEVQADVELARVHVTWPTPPVFAPGDGELDMLSGVLASGKSSRLYKRLVYDLQIAQDVSAHQSSARIASTFDIVVTMKKDKPVADALKVVDEELAKLRAAPPSADELDRVRAEVLAGMVFPLESVTARAEMFNRYNDATHDPTYLDKDIARCEAVTLKDVQKAATTYLPVSPRVVTVVTPTKGAPRAGKLVGGAS